MGFRSFPPIRQKEREWMGHGVGPRTSGQRPSRKNNDAARVGHPEFIEQVQQVSARFAAIASWRVRCQRESPQRVELLRMIVHLANEAPVCKPVR